MSNLETVVLLCLVVAVSVTILIIRDAVRNQRTQFDPEAPTIEPVSPTPSEQAAELTAIVEAGPTAFTLRPNWDEARPDDRFATQDADGYLKFHRTSPRHGTFENWLSNVSTTEYTGRLGPANPNWKQAIEQRPVKVGQWVEIKPPTPEQIAASAAHTWGNRGQLLTPVTTCEGTGDMPERDNCELISRDELERLRAVERMHNATASALDDLLDATTEFCRTKSQKAYLRLCKVLEVAP